jgi:hypothetical protein
MKKIIWKVLDEIGNMILNAAGGNEEVFEEIIKNLQRERIKSY